MELSWIGIAILGLFTAFSSTFFVVKVPEERDNMGALIAGALVSKAPKAKELSNALMSIKDLLLVGFFLTIGLNGLPTIDGALVAVALSVLLPLKALLFVVLLVGFGLRGRSAMLAALGLTPYSEFGLIIAAVAADKDLFDASWMVILAVAMGVSFVPLAVLNQKAFALYRQVRASLTRLERSKLIPPERSAPVTDAEVLVFGMGRVGTSAYDTIKAQLGEAVVAFDVDDAVVAAQQAAGRRVFEESATDADFWERLHVDRQQVRLIILAMHSHDENLAAIEQLRLEGFTGHVAATAYFDDEVGALEAAGADQVYHISRGAGSAMANAALGII